MQICTVATRAINQRLKLLMTLEEHAQVIKTENTAQLVGVLKVLSVMPSALFVELPFYSELVKLTQLRRLRIHCVIVTSANNQCHIPLKLMRRRSVLPVVDWVCTNRVFGTLSFYESVQMLLGQYPLEPSHARAIVSRLSRSQKAFLRELCSATDETLCTGFRFANMAAAITRDIHCRTFCSAVRLWRHSLKRNRQYG